MYLTCSVPFVSWTLVYKAMEGSTLLLTVDQLIQSARKAANPYDVMTPDKSWRSRLRRSGAFSEIFCGASFGVRARQTTLYKELQSALAPAQLNCDALDVVCFHLVGVPNPVAVIEDADSPFLSERVPVARREKVIDALRQLHQKWSNNNAAQVSAETAVLIEDCVYPVLDLLGEANDRTIVEDLRKRLASLQHPMSSSSLGTGSRSTAGRSNAATTMRIHATQRWGMDIERQMADDPRFRRYKQSKGWQAFYPSRETVLAYLTDMTDGKPAVVEDCRAMSSKEVVQLVSKLAPHIEADIFSSTEQGKDFVRAMTSTATLQQMSNWSTADAAQRMLVAHHPDWQTHYTHAWNLDRTTATEIGAYRQRWPKLPDRLIAGQGGDDQ